MEYLPPDSSMRFRFFQSIFGFLGKNRFALLFWSLLLTIGGGEVLSELDMSWGIKTLIALNLLVLLSVSRNKGFFWAGVILIIYYMICWCLSTFPDLQFLAPGGQSGALVLLVMGTQACFLSAFKNGPVDSERVYASLSLYLIIGLIFALIFSLVDRFLPASIHFPVPPVKFAGETPLSHFIYFSYVTLTTLGYGDIFPVSGPARGFAVLEAVIGQIYMVLVVARLVSLYGQSESR